MSIFRPDKPLLPRATLHEPCHHYPMSEKDPRRLHVLVASACEPGFALTIPLSYKLDALNQSLSQGSITPYGICQDPGQSLVFCPYDDGLPETPPPSDHVFSRPELYHPLGTVERDDMCRHAASLSAWADILVLAPIDADNIAKMLCGFSDDFVLNLLRGWDVSKEIVLIPCMSKSMWSNPMTQKHLSKIRRKWKWIRLLKPLLWSYQESVVDWRKNVHPDVYGDITDILKNQAEMKGIGQDVDLARRATPSPPSQRARSSVSLPPELWTIVLDHLGDWEIAKALGIYTNISTPSDWLRPYGSEATAGTGKDLEWAMLTQPSAQAMAKLERGPCPKRLSPLCVKLILRFAAIDLLSYLERHHPDLFMTTFGNSLLPTKASSFFGKVEVLEWWRTSPSFPTKEYADEAIDGASKAGFVHVLDWWSKSGLPLRYSEAALEQASAKGHLDVLEWWKVKSRHQDGYHIDADAAKHGTASPAPAPAATEGPLRLKVGKSICYAAQAGQTETIRWWAGSGIPYSHEETVAKIASAHGHVAVLELWRELKGEKMIFDNQVLVGPTKNGHRDVLGWWKASGLRVEYKTCDIEEALEDSLAGQDDARVLAWWETHGLLGVRTSEWMKVKVL